MKITPCLPLVTMKEYSHHSRIHCCNVVLDDLNCVTLIFLVSVLSGDSHKTLTIPGMMGVLNFPWRTPWGKDRWISSPTTLPNAAPILNTGIKLPDGTGIVEHTMEKNHWKTKENMVKLLLLIYSVKICKKTKYKKPMLISWWTCHQSRYSYSIGTIVEIWVYLGKLLSGDVQL